MDRNDVGVIHSMLDAISLSALLGYFMGALPTVALILTIVWTALRIWETVTVTGWRKSIKSWFKVGL